MRVHRCSRFVLAALALAVGACSDGPTAPATPLRLDEVLSEMSLSTVLPGGIGAPGGVPSTAIVPGNCSYSASLQSFVCAPVTAGTIRVDQSYTLLSAAGTPQPAFDPAGTAAVRMTTHAAGTTSLAGVSSVMDLQQTMTLSGLLTRTHVLDGTQLMRMSTTFPGSSFAPIGVGPSTFRSTIDTRIDGLVMPGRGWTERYPRAGSITMTMTEEDRPFNTGPFVIRM